VVVSTGCLLHTVPERRRLTTPLRVSLFVSLSSLVALYLVPFLLSVFSFFFLFLLFFAFFIGFPI
jgi:hypothetical protein